MPWCEQEPKVWDEAAEPLVNPQDCLLFTLVGAACDKKQVVAEKPKFGPKRSLDTLTQPYLRLIQLDIAHNFHGFWCNPHLQNPLGIKFAPHQANVKVA